MKTIFLLIPKDYHDQIVHWPHTLPCYVMIRLIIAPDLLMDVKPYNPIPTGFFEYAKENITQTPWSILYVN